MLALSAQPSASVGLLVAPPPSTPSPSPPRFADFCGAHQQSLTTDCILAAVIPTLPSVLLLLITLLKVFSTLCVHPSRSEPSGPPKQGRRRDRGLWLGALICSGLLFTGAVASIIIGHFLKGAHGRNVPLAWLVAPMAEAFAAVACAVVTGRSRTRGGRLWERVVVGSYSLLQAAASIVAMLALLPPEGTGNAWLVATLWRVGACCALSLTALWPNKLPRQGIDTDEFLAPPPGAPNMQSPMARALLQQVDEAASDAATYRRNQRDVWAEWLTYSSAQIAADSTNNANGTVTTSINGSSARPTHASDDLPYAVTTSAGASPHRAYQPSSRPASMAGLAQPQHDAQRGSGSSGTAGRLTAPPGARTPSSMPASPLSSASAFGGAPGRGDSSSDQRSGTDSTCFRTVADSGMSSTLVVPTRDAASTDGGRSSNPFALVPSGMSSAGGSGNRRQPLFDTSADVERWSEPLVTVEILGHMWVPDVDGGGKAGGLHLEFMLKTIGDEEAGARMVQRRFKDFDKLHTALVPIARRASVPLPPLPSSLTFGRNLTEEFANQRQIALQQWLSMVVARPPLWCDPLRLFLGLAEAPPSSSATPFRHSGDIDGDPSDHARAGEGVDSDGRGGGAIVDGNASSDRNGGDGTSEARGASSYSAELRWIVSRAQQQGCGVLTEGTGFFRASTIVKWLLVQALATSREQAVPMCEAMRRQGLILPVGDPTPFADGAALYRFPADLP